MSLGFGLALAGHAYLATHGLDYAQFVGGDMDISGVIMDDLIIYTQIDAPRWIGSGVAVLVMILLSAHYPAWRATRLDPSQAMRTYE